MKNKFIYSFILICMIFSLSGCFGKINKDNLKVTTTVYPVEYLISRLYGDNSEIKSIYPNETDISNYSLTKKQTKEYAKNTEIFVYNGLTNEKEIAKSFLDINKNIQIIDVTYGIKHTNGIAEFWLSPNNYLMLADTIKSDLEEILNNKYTIEKIEEKYTQLREDLSSLDAELRNIGKKAASRGNNTFAIADNAFSFLTEYGYQTIDISEEGHITSNVKSKFKDGTYKYILVSDEQPVPDYIKDIVDNYNTKLITVNVMTTLTDAERQANDNYLSIMKDFLSTLSGLNINNEEN